MTRTDKKEKQKKRIRANVRSILFLMAALFFAEAVYLMFFYNLDAYRRQATEESLADVYINYLFDNAESLDAAAGRQDAAAHEEETIAASIVAETIETGEIKATAGSDGVIHMENQFTDDHYYCRDGITFTPDYAVGDLVCVLEYPGVGIRRGVYTGTWDEIYHDLDLWMVTMARPDMVLGQTHLAVYGHNHPSQNLSFNNLNKARIGDQFYLYAESGVYTYEVVNIFADWRSDTTYKYVDDFTIGSDICYIITCGRDYFLINGSGTRYQDFIVEGHMISHQLISGCAEE